MFRSLKRQSSVIYRYGRFVSTNTALNANSFEEMFKISFSKPRIVINVKKNTNNVGDGGDSNNNDKHNWKFGNSFYSDFFVYIFIGFIVNRLFRGTRPRVQYHIATFEHVDAVVEVTNDAFMADAFFKKKEYHKRLTRADVMDMLNNESAVFLVGVLPNSVSTNHSSLPVKAPAKNSNESLIDGDSTDSYRKNFRSDFAPDEKKSEFISEEYKEKEAGNPENLSFDKNSFVCSSLYLSWHIDVDADGVLTLTGKISAVSVPSRWGKKGIGKKMIKNAEDYLLKKVAPKELRAYGVKECKVVMEMGVINVRDDLFPWYEKQGYMRGERLQHDGELDRIILPHMKDKVFCVRMSKELQDASAGTKGGSNL